MPWYNQIVKKWLERIENAKKARDYYFGEVARTIDILYNRSYKDVYLVSENDLVEGEASWPEIDTFYKPKLNKIHEFLALMVPTVLTKIPRRVVMPRLQHIPARLVEAGASDPSGLRTVRDIAAWMLEVYLNYTVQETDLTYEARMAVQEALLYGRGMLWSEVIDAGNRTLVTSSFDSWRNLLIDPDAQLLRDAGYIIRRRRMPKWQAQARLGLPDAVLESLADSLDPEDRRAHETEIVEYYEIYSRIGIGHVLAGPEDEDLGELWTALESMGQFCWLAIADGVEYPLNLRPDMNLKTEGEFRQALEWPLPLYGDVTDPWPVTFLDFYPCADNPWARSPLEPGIPFLAFLDHLYGYIMSRVRWDAKVIVAAPRGLQIDLDTMQESIRDVEVVYVDEDQIVDMAKAIVPIEIPPMKPEILTVLQIINRAFEQAVMLDPMMYGLPGETEPRSAFESRRREAHLSTRPKDMADTVEKWMSRVSRKEGILTRLYVGADTIAPLVGEPLPVGEVGEIPAGPLTRIWIEQINTDDPLLAVSEYEYSVATGSGRRHDPAYMSQVAQAVAQMYGTLALQEAYQTGNVRPFNKIVEMLGRILDVDLSEFMLTPDEVQARLAQQQAQSAARQQTQQRGARTRTESM